MKRPNEEKKASSADRSMDIKIVTGSLSKLTLELPDECIDLKLTISRKEELEASKPSDGYACSDEEESVESVPQAQSTPKPATPLASNKRATPVAPTLPSLSASIDHSAKYLLDLIQKRHLVAGPQSTHPLPTSESNAEDVVQAAGHNELSNSSACSDEEESEESVPQAQSTPKPAAPLASNKRATPVAPTLSVSQAQSTSPLLSALTDHKAAVLTAKDVPKSGRIANQALNTTKVQSVKQIAPKSNAVLPKPSTPSVPSTPKSQAIATPKSQTPSTPSYSYGGGGYHHSWDQDRDEYGRFC
ncbi:hypothetical protein QR680_014947 [Steinernema hermaphroditum]|uniref:Uncharacterized protein n=1 Tax=Steinernema hermaphroditum TaxID=289476 RepID=A0AA39IAN2_9BILA|nr:hypothetical protein QR680_014947 [Steinernema hermaphroditum]